MNVSDPRYVSDIPAGAEPMVRRRYRGGPPRLVEYRQGAQIVGRREFSPTGLLLDEEALRDGVRHGRRYQWREGDGSLLCVTPYERGLEHGTASQWAHDGRLLGSYTMTHGTGIDLWWQDGPDGSADLVEVAIYRDGQREVEWSLCAGRLRGEQHWHEGQPHGIERSWGPRGGLQERRFWRSGERLTRRAYLRAMSLDPSLPSWRPEDDRPFRINPSLGEAPRGYPERERAGCLTEVVL